MGIFTPRNSLAQEVSNPGYRIASPWADSSSLETIIVSALTGYAPEYSKLDRDLAQTIPAVRAAVLLLIETAGSLPLKAFKDGAPIAVQPSWLTRTSSIFQNAYNRNCRVLLDLFFDGQSLLYVTKRGADGYPSDVLHVPAKDWRVEGQRILIEDKPVSQADCIFIQTPHGGLLRYAQRSLQHALQVESIVAARSATPAPILALKLTNGANVSPEAMEQAVEQFKLNRNKPNGMITALPVGVEIEVINDANYKDFLFQARSAVARDVAQLTGIPSMLLETTSGVTSDTYTTELGARSRLIDFSLRLWIDPVQARLSDGDVTPLGTSVAYDLSELVSPASFLVKADAERRAIPASSPTSEPVGPALTQGATP